MNLVRGVFGEQADIEFTMIQLAVHLRHSGDYL